MTLKVDFKNPDRELLGGNSYYFFAFFLVNRIFAMNY